MGRYAEAFHRSLADPEGFWGEAAKDIDWYQAPTGCWTPRIRRSTTGSPTGS